MFYLIVALLLIIFAFWLSEPNEIQWIIFGVSLCLLLGSFYSVLSSDFNQEMKAKYCESVGGKSSSAGCIHGSTVNSFPSWLVKVAK